MENESWVILLTGRRGVGKTTVCRAVAELARRRGYRPGGVITPAIYDGCRAKVGFEAMDVSNSERWPLARTDREMGGPQVGPYSFDRTALARALEVLRRAISAGCDLLMVDEIGPLELEQGQGFAPILDLLPPSPFIRERPGTTSLDLVRWRISRTCSAPAERETSFSTPEGNSYGIESLPGEKPMHILIVVRPALLNQLLLHLRDTEFTVFNATVENRDELPRQIVERLWEGNG